MPKSKKHSSAFPIWGSVLALALAASMAPQAKAGTIIVDDAPCDLTNAVITANTGMDIGGCTGGSADPNVMDTIDLLADVTVTTTPLVTSKITIAGNNHTISGGNATQVLRNNGGELTVRDATITGGWTWGYGGGHSQ